MTPPVVSAQPVQSRSSTFGIAELRSMFAPYARPSIGSSTERLQTRRRSGARDSQERSWGQKFYCLASPAMVTVPNTDVKRILTEAGLGQEIIQLRKQVSDLIKE